MTIFLVMCELWPFIFFIEFFYTTMNIHSIMSKLTIEVLSKICEKLPDDYIVEFVSSDGVTYHLSDVFEVDVSEEKLVLKS